MLAMQRKRGGRPLAQIISEASPRLVFNGFEPGEYVGRCAGPFLNRCVVSSILLPGRFWRASGPRASDKALTSTARKPFATPVVYNPGHL